MLLNVEENDAVVVVVCIESGDKFIAVTIPVIKVVVTKLEIPTPVPVVVAAEVKSKSRVVVINDGRGLTVEVCGIN